jgi:hypothetical protein
VNKTVKGICMQRSKRMGVEVKAMLLSMAVSRAFLESSPVNEGTSYRYVM